MIPDYMKRCANNCSACRRNELSLALGFKVFWRPFFDWPHVKEQMPYAASYKENEQWRFESHVDESIRDRAARPASKHYDSEINDADRNDRNKNKKTDSFHVHLHEDCFGGLDGI